MMGSVFSDTLQEITDTKLDELSKRRTTFEDAKTSILLAIQLEDDPIKRLVILGDGVKRCFAIKVDYAAKVLLNGTNHTRLETELKNLERFLDQAKYDPSLSTSMLERWEQSLLRHLETHSLKFRYASLYGQLVTEWLSTSKGSHAPGISDDTEMEDAYEDVGSAAKLEARRAWEEMVFEPAKVDETAFRGYLDRIFGFGNEAGKNIRSALESLRCHVSIFEGDLSPDEFNTSNLRWVIRGLHASDLLSDEKRVVLKDFESNDIILAEIADVLNMRLSALDSWTWSAKGTPVLLEMRRKINGVFDIQMQEDLLQAIFLQYVGAKWSIELKNGLNGFREEAWKSPRSDIPKIDKQRMGYYLGPMAHPPSLHTARNTLYTKKYFLAQLLDRQSQTTRYVEGEVEADYDQPMLGTRKRTAGKCFRKVPFTKRQKQFYSNIDEGSDHEDYDHYEDDEEKEEPHSTMELKQTLLHVLSTEITLNTRLYDEMTAFHSVFQSWKHLLPHEIVRMVLQYFGVSDTWLNFFDKFLKVPLTFPEDKNGEEARERRRGTPPSHLLSNFFGEAVLFCLDLAINQETSGFPIWRVHDDIWFWSRDHSTVVKAWKTVKEFASVTGTEINPAKTGSVRVSKSPDKSLPIDKSLPKGDIRWGLLRLSPQTGRFEIDQDLVDTHIAELRKQLGGNHGGSILGFIQAWNTFAGTFFTTNFGKAAGCFGRAHVDNMLDTHQRIQKEVLAMLDGEEEKVTSVAEHLKREIRKRFDIDDIPDGFLYFPLELGGLDLQSPFVSLLQIRDEVPRSPSQRVGLFEAAEYQAYAKAKKLFHNGYTKQERQGLADPDWVPASAHDRRTFLPFEEFARHREYYDYDFGYTSSALDEVFNALMRRPAERSVDVNAEEFWTSLEPQLRAQANLRGITGHWDKMEPYWRWVAMVYGPEIATRFGGLNIVDAGLLPMGMVSLFRDRRVKW